MDAILGSESSVAAGIKYLFHFLRQKSEEKFGPAAGISAVTGFLFLRFFVPAIRDPQTFGLWRVEIDNEDKKTLQSIAQLVQKIANMVKFRPEDDLAVFNDFIEGTRQSITDFVRDVTKLPNELPKPKNGLQINSLIAYDAACLLHHLDQHTDYFENNKDDPDVVQLLAILEPINKKRYSIVPNTELEDSKRKKEKK